jgi:beta-phosphoglucomutase
MQSWNQEDNNAEGGNRMSGCGCCKEEIVIPGLGKVIPDSGLKKIQKCNDGCFETGKNGVETILQTGDAKVEFIAFKEKTIAYVRSRMGYPAYYPVLPVQLKKPVKAVLMDLDGTTVKSEEFWIWIIQKTCCDLTGDAGFEFDETDLPHVSGHSVSEHLKYCIGKYSPDSSLEEARESYYKHTHGEMDKIMHGEGKKGAFTPAAGVREFLLELKEKNVKIGLVTSGLYEKAYPEILSAFDAMGMGDPRDFYDSIITAGFPLRKGSVGTLGELSPKPHPWLYAETARVGLGISFEDRDSVIGIEDSGAGACSIRLAGFTTIGVSGGNITESGTRGLCSYYCENFEEILKILF